MTQHIRRVGEGRESVLSFVRPSEPDLGANALNLVYQAAEVFSDMEDRARETEARARSMCKAATERLLSAEARSEAADRARRAIIAEAECKLQDASRALRQAELQITAAEDRATATELRAQLAEAKAREAVEALALVEEAIRRRFCASSSTEKKLNAAA
ncbi:MAG: hypothetical protein WA832_21690 [Bradyrhizobium sp.]|uniref:hypothetical protein n=1 Tax=Bradyrhizobium sp. TaxID=376 RepID=UPI003C7BCCE1